MKYKPYPKYKDTGIEWLGEIPEHWEVKKLKYIVCEPLKYGANEVAELDDPSLPRYIRITDVNEDGTLKNETFKSLPINIAKDYLLDKGDILLARSGATVGKTFIYDISWGKAAYAGYLIRARVNANKYSAKYVYYYFQTNNYWSWISSTIIQSTIQNVSADKYNVFTMAVPQSIVQDKIVEFLNTKTARIDTLIEKKKRQIELLREKRSALITHAVTKGLDPNVRMKDSGIEWLGEIPEHWSIRKLKFIATVKNSNVDKRSKENEIPVKLCNYIDVYYNDYITKDIDFMDATATEEEVNKFSLARGDVIITKDSESWDDIAVPAYVGNNLMNTLCGYHLALIRGNNELIEPEYLFRSFITHGINDQFRIASNGITRFGLGQNGLKSALFVLPPIREQSCIAKYINSKTAQIDALIEKVKKSIDLLKEYRSALITAAVTGKIDVRNELDQSFAREENG